MSYFLLADSITLTLLVVLTLIIAYYVYYTRKNNIFRRLGIPGPEPIPFFGETINYGRKGVNMTDIDLVKKYGKVVGYYEGMTPIILVTDPELLRNILIRDSIVFINRRTPEGAGGIFEHGLTMLKDEKWKNARSIVSPTFSSAKLKAMHPLMNRISDEYNQRLLEYADKQEIFDIKTLNSLYTLDNIASCLFGIETNSLQNENSKLVDYLKKFFIIRYVNILLFFIFFTCPRLLSYLEKKGISFFPMDAVDYTTNIVNQVLDRRRQRLEQRNDFIQMMVDHEKEVELEEQQMKQQDQQWGTLKKTLNNKEILAQALIFLVAGYESTSALMSFFFYVMATEPVVQEKIYEEIQREIGDEEITYDNLQQLQYLDMVINETLRMYPPFIRFDRVASQDYQLGNYRIPKGSLINVPVYPIHHDPDVWPEPEKFIPERFSSEEKAKRPTMTYLPFGDGPRNCIGMRFALLEAKVAVAKAVRVVEFQTSEKTQIPIQLGKMANLNTRTGIWLRVIRRSQ